ncbi:hypothetical protein EDC56_2815 [Sinobacterium caligoides]|uniref:N-acetyltransferase domain-containing protein n=1 Tax=Sinobacterium caligoides TaxID=933926 RepID=A0A3N2DK76_9GAMM|nr:hypothetical protein [Sinobacterium caligoides]ROS00178.1 hypothetical protein EDC56_2815 [Sinobacterium caligoides]
MSQVRGKTPDFAARIALNKKRFGDVPSSCLGELKDVKEIQFPEVYKQYCVKGNDLVYKKIANVEEAAERIAYIYIHAIDEMVGNSDYEWHHDPASIIARYQTGDWAFYGIYLEGDLISVVSMFINRGQKYMQWVWGAVDPQYRGKGAWVHVGQYLDSVVEASGAQMGKVWCATTHCLSQRTAESAGYDLIALNHGGEFLGGSDGKYYRQNVAYYSKLYGDGAKHVQPDETMVLTPKTEKLFRLLKELNKAEEAAEAI